jgi:hypothetical protein
MPTVVREFARELAVQDDRYAELQAAFVGYYRDLTAGRKWTGVRWNRDVGCAGCMPKRPTCARYLPDR